MIWGELAISLIVPPGSQTSGIFRIGPELEPKHLISQARTLLSVRFDAQPQRAPKPKIAKFGMFPARSEVTAQQEPHKIPPQFGVRSTSTWYPTRDTTFQNFSLMLLRETTTLTNPLNCTCPIWHFSSFCHRAGDRVCRRSCFLEV